VLHELRISRRGKMLGGGEHALAGVEHSRNGEIVSRSIIGG
jgi:hypothetical protein